MTAMAGPARFSSLLLQRRTELRATIALILMLIVAPTVAYAITADIMGFSGQRFNYDFFALYIGTVLIARLRRPLAIAFAVAGALSILSVQILLGVGVIYLDNPALITEYFSFIAYWPWGVIGFWFAVTIAVFGVFALLLNRIAVERAAIAPLAASLALIMGADFFGQSTYGQEAIGGNWVTSSGFRGYQFVRKVIIAPSWTAKPYAAPMMARELTVGAPPPRILSVAVESWGRATSDEGFNQAILAPMRREIERDYDVRIVSHSFNGTTLSGEFRELCNQETAGKPTRAQALAVADACLPAILKARGYATLGMHGNSKNFYNRSMVYPALGFQRAQFYETYAASGKPFAICRYNAFQGVCDREILSEVLAFFAAHPKAYAHIMSLDTHFPLAENEAGDSTCAPTLRTKDAGLCLYANQFASYFQQVARKIRLAKVKPDIVYMFGDHAPPYALVSQREFFDQANVPVLILTLKKPPIS